MLLPSRLWSCLAFVALVRTGLPSTNLYQLLVDKAFRMRCLGRVTDPLVLQTFDAFDRIRDQVQEAGGALRRAFLMSFHPAARLTLGHSENWLDFRQIMDAGRSVIINLGNINGGETRRLIGAMLLVQIEQAALSRTNYAPAQRRPFAVFVDERPTSGVHRRGHVT
jgi:hypothetical protein